MSIDIFLGLSIIFLLFYISLIIAIALFRSILWKLSFFFKLIDEFVWFLYNPFRWTMRVGYEGKSLKRYRFFYALSTYTLLYPIYKICVYFFTTPLRVITAIYFDIVMYLVVSAANSIDDLIHPKNYRLAKGFSYFWRWLLLFPIRLFWFLMKNTLTVIDSICMFLVSVAWPTFTMYHGTSQSAVVDITKRGRWFVGKGNFGGSGIYFGRSVKTATRYSEAISQHNVTKTTDNKQPIIVARVSLTVLRNCFTLPASARQHFGDMGSGGSQLAKAVRFPFYATELWRDGTNWWEYCLVQGGKDGEFISSWRIRPIGYVHVSHKGEYTGSLQRLWGGSSHYVLGFKNIIMSMVSAPIAFGVMILYLEYLNSGNNALHIFAFLAGALFELIHMLLQLFL